MTHLKNVILYQFPFPVAVRYRRMLETETFESKATNAVRVYEAGLRSLTLGLLGQFLQQDLGSAANARLKDLTWRLVEHPQSPGVWTDVFIGALETLRGQRHRFFMRELYDFFWGSPKESIERQEEVRAALKRIVNLAGRVTGAPPKEPSGWEELYQQLDTALHQILSQFVFVAGYDLLYIASAKQGVYIYDVYKGEQVTRAAKALETSQSLKQGWCYLKRSGRDELLEVHPLILYWDVEAGDTEQSPEVVVYHWYEEQKARLWYLHSARDEVPTENDEIVNVFDRVYYAKLKALRPKHVTSELEWVDLGYLAERIEGREQMQAARSKYNPDLYLQREEIRDIYGEFLQSDKTGLILVGPSGVGKTNFVFSIIDESQKTGSSVHTLVYKGIDHRLNFEQVRGDHFSDDTSFAEVLAGRFEDVLAQDFNTYLLLQQGLLDGPAVLRVLDELLSKHGGQVVIIVDALNENREGSLLLRGINRFVEKHPYPWLKLLITSRPESWSEIRKGIPLSTVKYFRPTTEEVHEAAPFGLLKDDPVVLIKRFKDTELPLVYDKYRKKYNLRTQYDHLTTVWKGYLSDPLALRLESEIATQHDGLIPVDLPPEELLERYVDMLKETHRLEMRDLDFLEKDILPRLFQAPEYPNQLVHTSLIGAKATSGSSLYDLVFNYDEYTVGDQGYRVNQSFVNLADALILTKSELAVQFQYERFYEHFGGIYLSNVAAGQFQFYRELGDALEQKPYLWGTVKNALKNELKYKREYRFFADLANSATFTRRLLRNAILTGLEEFGRLSDDNYAQARSLVERLIEPCHGPVRSVGETLRRLLRRSEYDAEEIETRQSVAVEAAGRLRFEGVLLNAAADRYGRLRRASVLQIFRLWQEDRTVGYGIVESLGQFAVARMGLPDLGVIDSLISLSIAMLVNAHTDEDVQRQVLRLGRRVIRDILVLSPEEGAPRPSLARRALARVLRRPVLSTATGWGLGIIDYWGQRRLPVTRASLEHLFTLTAAEKELAYPLLPYFDAAQPGLADQVERIMAIEDGGDFALGFIPIASRIVRTEINYLDSLTTLRALVDRSLSQDPPRPMIENYLWCALMLAERQRPPDPALFVIGERCAKAIAEDPRGWFKSHVSSAAVPILPVTAGLGYYIMLLQTYGQPVRSAVLRKWIQRAIDNGDTEFLLTFVNSELNNVFDSGYLNPALEALELVANYQDEGGEVQKAVADLIVRMYFYFPREIDNVLAQKVFSSQISSLVRATAPSDRVDDLMGMRAIGILIDLFLLGPPILREETIYLVEQALHLPDLKSVIALLIKEMLNLLAGEAIFTVPVNSPSRQTLGPKAISLSQ